MSEPKFCLDLEDAFTTLRLAINGTTNEYLIKRLCKLDKELHQLNEIMLQRKSGKKERSP
jgi:hypothetical protein